MSDSQAKGPGIHRVASPQQWRDWVRSEAKRCVLACKARGLTNYDIGAYCGVHRTRVSHWVTEKSTPDGGAFEALKELAADCGSKRKAAM